MRISLKYALWLLAALPGVTGCDHKTAPAPVPQVLAPPIVDNPPPKPAEVSTADLPPPIIGNTPPPETKDTTPKPPEPVKKPVHRPKKPSAAQPAPAPAQETANATPPPVVTQPAPAPVPSVSAIGPLSGGASENAKSEVETRINSIERGVNGVNRTLSDAEAKTAAQIREFLKQAREALATGDVDGAKTLADKANVLLQELNQ